MSAAGASPRRVASRKLGLGTQRGRAGAHYDRAIELSDYQRLSRRTASYPREAWLAYPALGLAGEAGEVAEHAKKAIRDDGGVVTEERRVAMAKELGDVLWYVSQLATELELDLDEIAQANLDKLLS
ncbi:MAG TPA: nucleoside triphosphate pyrophosphohydrolase family protein, partial [Solirubrobacteraceae bacterium]|nr:nucleoside triphosphate pyrophosphohydrolase family protein [Solirubrobacteraceae bacterium]